MQTLEPEEEWDSIDNVAHTTVRRQRCGGDWAPDADGLVHLGPMVRPLRAWKCSIEVVSASIALHDDRVARAYVSLHFTLI